MRLVPWRGASETVFLVERPSVSKTKYYLLRSGIFFFLLFGFGITLIQGPISSSLVQTLKLGNGEPGCFQVEAPRRRPGWNYNHVNASFPNSTPCLSCLASWVPSDIAYLVVPSGSTIAC